MSGMIDRGKYASLAEALADVADIDKVIVAVAREAAIREGMAATGESREIVTEAVDATTSMDQEAVLELMDGEPTTLGRGLARYVEELEKELTDDPNDEETGRGSRFGAVVGELDALLKYPWPGAGPTDQEWSSFCDDVTTTLLRKLQPTPFGPTIGEASAEVVALVKDRFFPDR